MKDTRTYIPTYEVALEMTKTSEPVFYENKYVVDGYNVSIFNYHLASYKDFVTPLEGKDYNAYEMRGMCFIFNSDGSLFNRYILLEKFFNLNQVDESMYNIVKDYGIKCVNNKEDGSVASFIKLPNGNVYGKSKMSFESEQALGITKIYRNNETIKNFVDYTLDNNLVAIFEYVAPHNRIVVRYEEEELILLKVRDNLTGRYIDLKDLDYDLSGIKIAPFVEYTLDELIELCEVEEDKEGYVVHSIDENGYDFFYKMKTVWYFNLHGLLTNDLYREHTLINHILDDTIDDVISQIPDNEVETRLRIDKIINIVKHEVNLKSEEIGSLYSKFSEMGCDKKEFSLKFNKNKNFGMVMSLINGKSNLYDLSKVWVSKECSKLEMARQWLSERDPSVLNYKKE